MSVCSQAYTASFLPPLTGPLTDSLPPSIRPIHIHLKPLRRSSAPSIYPKFQIHKAHTENDPLLYLAFYEELNQGHGQCEWYNYKYLIFGILSRPHLSLF